MFNNNDAEKSYSMSFIRRLDEMNNEVIDVLAHFSLINYANW